MNMGHNNKKVVRTIAKTELYDSKVVEKSRANSLIIAASERNMYSSRMNLINSFQIKSRKAF